MFIDFLSVISSFENELRKERQADGIVKAKANGIYKGRKPSIDRGKVKLLSEGGMGASSIAKELGCDRPTVYRCLN